MNLKKVKISDIEPNDYNTNVQMPKDYEKLLYMIKTYGQVLPILVRQEKNKYIIIDGEHRYKACKELNIDTMWVVVYEGEKSLNDYKILTTGLNLTGGTSSPDALAKLFADLDRDVYEEFVNLFNIKSLKEQKDIITTNNFARFNIDWDDEDVWEEQTVAYDVLTITGTTEEIKFIRSLMNSIKSQDTNILKMINQSVSKRPIDDDEAFYLLSFLALNRLFQQKETPNNKNFIKPISIVFRIQPENVKDLLDYYKQIITNNRR